MIMNDRRDADIYIRRLAGESVVEIARHYGISSARVSQILNRAHDHATRRQRIIVGMDQNTALFGEWWQKVYLLLPHIEAIKAIAEEKNK